MCVRPPQSYTSIDLNRVGVALIIGNMRKHKLRQCEHVMKDDSDAVKVVIDMIEVNDD